MSRLFQAELCHGGEKSQAVISCRGVRSATEETQEIPTHNIWKNMFPFPTIFLESSQGIFKKSSKELCVHVCNFSDVP